MPFNTFFPIWVNLKATVYRSPSNQRVQGVVTKQMKDSTKKGNEYEFLRLLMAKEFTCQTR